MTEVSIRKNEASVTQARSIGHDESHESLRPSAPLHAIKLPRRTDINHAHTVHPLQYFSKRRIHQITTANMDANGVGLTHIMHQDNFAAPPFAILKREG